MRSAALIFVTLSIVGSCGGTAAPGSTTGRQTAAPAPAEATGAAAARAPAATAQPSPAPDRTPTPPPAPASVAFGIRFDPPTPVPGREFTLIVQGLDPGEQVEIRVTVGDGAATPVSYAADASGEFRTRFPADGPPSFTIEARRAMGQVATARVGTSVTSVASPTTSAPPATTSRPAFGIRFEPATPLPENTFTLIVFGLDPGEAFEIQVTPSGGVGRPETLTADAEGEWRSHYPADRPSGFAIEARRGRGEIARAQVGTYVAAVASPTASPGLATPAAAPAPTPCTGPGDPARTGISGAAGYFEGTRLVTPVAGVTIQARDQTTGGRVLGATMTSADGRYRILGLAAGSKVIIGVPEQAFFIESFNDQRIVEIRCNEVLEDGERIRVTRYLTGLNYAQGAQLPQRATLRWDPAPGVTSYCAEISGTDGGPYVGRAAGLGQPGVCPGFNLGWPLGNTTSFTLPSGLSSGEEIGFVVRGYAPGVSLPVAMLRGGRPACCDGEYRFTIR